MRLGITMLGVALTMALGAGTAAASEGGEDAHSGEPKLRLAVRPQTVAVKRRTSFVLRVSANGSPIAGALVTLAGKRARSGANGRATIVAALDRAGSWTARATKDDFRAGRATVTARRDRPSSFTGDCDFAGTVWFDPPLTNTARPTRQRVRGPGTCSGTFVDGRGRTHDFTDAPATYLDHNLAEAASCSGGSAVGGGSLVFPWGDIDFTMTEERVAAVAIATLTGARSGSARAIGTASGDPVATLQKCAGPGLKQSGLSGHVTTTQTITG